LGLGLWEKAPLIPFLTLLLIGSVTSDNAVMSTATAENCYYRGGEQWCEWTHTATLTLLPAGQPVELLLRSETGEPAGTLRFSIDAISVECVAEEVGWAYSYNVKIPSVKRCPGMGSCDWTGCPKFALEEVPELAQECPGCKASCLDSCSQWWCKCGMGPGLATVAKACLFYGTKAEPTASNDTATFFTCPVWRQLLKMKLEVETLGTKETRELGLHPGMTTHLPNISLTPIALSQAPAPVLDSLFVTDGSRVGIVEELPPHLHCRSEGEARSRECRLGESACTNCEANSDTTIKCQCHEWELEEALGGRPLPLEMELLRLDHEGRDVVAATSAAPIQLHLKLEGFSVALNSSYTNCTILPGPLKGFYRVPGGATFAYQCRTESGSALSEVSCEGGSSFVSRCSTNPTNTTVHLTLPQAVVDTSCRVECPGGTTSFQLSGHLQYRSIAASLASEVLSDGNSDGIESSDDGEWWPSPAQWWEQLKEVDMVGWIDRMVGRQLLPFLLLAGFLGLGVLWQMRRAHPIHRGYKLLARAAMVGMLIPVGTIAIQTEGSGLEMPKDTAPLHPLQQGPYCISMGDTDGGGNRVGSLIDLGVAERRDERGGECRRPGPTLTVFLPLFPLVVGLKEIGSESGFWSCPTSPDSPQSLLSVTRLPHLLVPFVQWSLPQPPYKPSAPH
jgi:hypothetical protein